MKLPFIFFPLLLLCASTLRAQTPEISPRAQQSAEVYFDFGKYTLRPEAIPELQNIAVRAKTMDSFKIKITAHTDSVGTLENNLALSEQRANAIKKFFVKQGIPGDNLTLAFFGETRPASENATGEGRQLNRRASVELIAIPVMLTVEGTVTDARTNKPLVAEVVFHTKESRDSVTTDSTGYFKKSFPPGTVVGIDAFARCYFMKSEMVKAEPGLRPLTLPLKPALAGEKADIENLYFVGGLAVLLEKSKPELPKIFRFMQANPEMKIEIAGHINFPNRPAVVKESAEYKLSVARAKLVYDYLISKGISADRLSFNGYGNWEMRFPKAISEQQQAMNRRVEIRVIEGGCP